jgi:hypothetical protein
MNKLNSLTEELESYIPQFEKSNKAVSHVTAGWHIDHAFLAISRMITGLKNANPTGYKPAFNIKRLVVFAIGKIPRGKGKAPEAVMPEGAITDELLRLHAAKTKEKIKEIPALPANAFIEHPVFGHLKTKQTMRMIEIHTRHHIGIIKDILK